jgi:mannose-6-phosphate isomerase-like protein (cupin superfamily)
MLKEVKRIVEPVNSEHYLWGNNCDGWHLLKTENLSVIKETMPKGTEEKLHYHQKSQQFFYILSGEASFVIDGITFTVRQNQGISVSPHEIHKISNKTEEDLEFLVISSPVSHGDRVDI